MLVCKIHVLIANVIYTIQTTTSVHKKLIIKSVTHLTISKEEIKSSFANIF
jgi:hypothetical protein